VATEKRLINAWKRLKTEDRSLHAYLTFAIRKLARDFGKDPAVILKPRRRGLGQKRF